MMMATMMVGLQQSMWVITAATAAAPLSPQARAATMIRTNWNSHLALLVESPGYHRQSPAAMAMIVHHHRPS